MSICKPEVPGALRNNQRGETRALFDQETLLSACLFVRPSISGRNVVHTSTCGMYRRVCQGEQAAEFHGSI